MIYQNCSWYIQQYVLSVAGAINRYIDPPMCISVTYHFRLWFSHELCNDASLEVAIHNMMTTSIGNISALLALCAGNSPVTGEFPSQRPVRRSFDVFFDLRLNQRLSKQTQGWWFETPSYLLWRHCNGCFRFGCVTFTSIRWFPADPTNKTDSIVLKK